MILAPINRILIALIVIIISGCNAVTPKQAHDPLALPNDNDVLEPVQLDLPFVAPNSSFGGVWPPDVLSAKELTQFLETPLPPAGKVPAEKTLVAVVSEASGKSIIWERATHAPPRAPTTRVETELFHGSFPFTARPSFRDAIGVILAIADQDSINIPTDNDYDFRNFVIVTRGHIIVLSLPVGKSIWPPKNWIGH